MTSSSPAFRLAEQAIGWRPHDRRLIVVQRWAGFSAGREAFVLCVNGAITVKRAGPPHRVAQEFAAAADLVRPFTVTEGRGRDRLVELGLPWQLLCPGCGQRLPIGSLYCTGCGLPSPAGVPAPALVAVSAAS